MNATSGAPTAILELVPSDLVAPADTSSPTASNSYPALTPDPTAFATDIIARCLEAGADAVLFLPGALPPAFFDLRTRLAGELLQKLANYRLRMAAVVPDLAEATARSDSFRDFVREVNAGRLCRLTADRNEALAWIEGA